MLFEINSVLFSWNNAFFVYWKIPFPTWFFAPTNWNIISISLYDADDDLYFFFHVLILLQQSMAGFNVQYYSLETHRPYCSPGCMPFTLQSKNNIQEILNFLIFKRKFHWKCMSVSTYLFTENFQVCPSTDPHWEVCPSTDPH